MLVCLTISYYLQTSTSTLWWSLNEISIDYAEGEEIGLFYFRMRNVKIYYFLLGQQQQRHQPCLVWSVAIAHQTFRQEIELEYIICCRICKNQKICWRFEVKNLSFVFIKKWWSKNNWKWKSLEVLIAYIILHFIIYKLHFISTRRNLLW